MAQSDNIVKGSDLPDLPDKSLGKLMHQHLDGPGDKPAFIHELTGEELSYQQLQKVACKLARSLKSCGYTKEDVVGICSENSIHYFCPIVAAVYLGIPIAPISHHYGRDELEHALKIVKPKLVFCTETTAATFLNLKQADSTIERIVILGVKKAMPGTVTLEDFISGEKGSFEPENVDAETHTAFILFSSGTTGLPKGVMLTHKNCLVKTMYDADPKFYKKFFEVPVNLGYLPFAHLGGLSLAIGILLLGNTIAVMPKFEERPFLAFLQKHRISSLFLIPTLMVMLVKSPILHEYDLSALEEIFVGSARITETLEEQVKTRLGVKCIRQTYALTETTFPILCVPSGVQRAGSAGTVVPGMAVAVRDPESSRFLGPNQIGEICTKGDLVMKGYYNNPKATEDTFTDDGWLKTGDLGYYDNENFFYIVDRIKDLIKYKCFQVPPAEIEGLLQKHPKVKEAAVVGLPDELAGELALAFVVKQPGVEVTENEIKTYVAEHLSKHKHLHGGVRFIEAIPKTPIGKMLKKDLKKTLTQ